MVRFRRKNTAWLTVMGLIVFLALAAAGTSITPPVAIALLAILVTAALVSSVEVGRDRENLMSTIRRMPTKSRMSAQAREAAERAKAHGGYVSSGITLMDVGLIAVQSSTEGMAMRRTRSISKDDDGARPFITLNIEPEDADRNVLIRFEITSQGGESVFVHEMKAFLRDGEMSIMADHHLPLLGNSRVQGMGDWDLRVFMDGNLIGMHNFTLAPSMRERNRRLAGDYEVEQASQYAPADEFDIIDELKQERAPKPPSLNDLLQEQRSSRLSSNESNTSSSSVNSDRESRRLSNTPRRRR
jgi:hypothetical protein